MTVSPAVKLGKDKEVSRRIKAAGDLLGINLDDHLIIAHDGFVSAML